MAMTAPAQSPGTDPLASEPRSGGLGDVLDVILDKGLVIDAFIRVSLVGIEILTIDARIVVASVDTYMYFAERAHRLEMGGGQGSAKQGLAGMMGSLAEGGAHNITRGALRGAGEGLREGLLPPRKEPGERRGVVQRAVGAIQDALLPDDSKQDEDDGKQERAPAQDSRPSAPAATARPRRPRRPQSGGGLRGSSQGGTGGPAPQGGQETSGGGPPRRSAPASRQAPSRGDPED